MSTTAETQWIDDFIIELRLREVRGDAIGDAVASVRELLADSGEDPHRAFGTPREYAAQLELPLVEGAGANPGATLAQGLGVLALLVYVPAAWAFFGREPLGYSLPQLLLLLIPLVVVATLPLYLDKLVRHFWVLLAALGLCIAAAVASSFFAPAAGTTPWLRADALAVAAASALVLLATAAWGIRSTARSADDPIVDPLAAPGKPSARSRILSTVLPHALMPLFALGTAVAAWLLAG